MKKQHWRFYIKQIKTKLWWKRIILYTMYRFGFFKKSLYCLSCSAWISSHNPVHGCTEAKLEIRNRN